MLARPMPYCLLLAALLSSVAPLQANAPKQVTTLRRSNPRRLRWAALSATSGLLAMAAAALLAKSRATPTTVPQALPAPTAASDTFADTVANLPPVQRPCWQALQPHLTAPLTPALVSDISTRWQRKRLMEGLHAALAEALQSPATAQGQQQASERFCHTLEKLLMEAAYQAWLGRLCPHRSLRTLLKQLPPSQQRALSSALRAQWQRLMPSGYWRSRRRWLELEWSTFLVAQLKSALYSDDTAAKHHATYKTLVGAYYTQLAKQKEALQHSRHGRWQRAACLWDSQRLFALLNSVKQHPKAICAALQAIITPAFMAAFARELFRDEAYCCEG